MFLGFSDCSVCLFIMSYCQCKSFRSTLSFTMNHLHIRFMKPAFRQHRRWIIKIPKRHLQYGEPAREEDDTPCEYDDASLIDRGRERERGMLPWLGCSTIFLLSMTSDILPFPDSKRMCTTGVNRVITHVVHLDGSSLIIKMRHGYERGCLTLRARRK